MHSYFFCCRIAKRKTFFEKKFQGFLNFLHIFEKLVFFFYELKLSIKTVLNSPTTFKGYCKSI